MNNPSSVLPAGYAIVARDLVAAGIDTVFGVMGEANLDLIACLVDRHRVRYVANRHEAGAVAMADGFARSSGRIGVATVTCGPGLTNALTPLVTAVRAHAELLLVTGQLPSSATGRSQLIDHVALLVPTGTGIVHVETADELPGAVSRAIELIRQTRRPVVLNILLPVLDGPCEEAPGRPATDLLRSAPPPISDDAIGRALATIAAGRNVVILAGRGAAEAGLGPALADLADRTGAGLAVTLLAHGLFSGHPRDLGVAGGLSSPETQEALTRADVLLVVGAGLNGWTTRAGTAGRSAIVIQVDSDPKAFRASSIRVDLAIVGDGAAIVARLLDALQPASFQHIRKQAPAAPSEPPGGPLLDPRVFCRRLDAMLPRNRTVTVDAGQFFEFPTRCLAVPDERGYLFTIAFGTVGLGLGTAVGAALGRPDRLSVAFVGDGGLMMSLSDLDVIARERLPMAVVVINDGAYGAEIKHLADRGWSTDLARFANPDFAALARTLGMEGLTVRTLNDVAALGAVLGGLSAPVLIDAHVDPSVKAEWMSVMHAAREQAEVAA